MLAVRGVRAVVIRRRLLAVAVLAPLLGLPSLTESAAAPTPPGTITGTVTGPGATPVEDVQVVVTQPGPFGEGPFIEPVLTAADGTYEIEVAAGMYAVEFTPPSGSTLAPEAWDDTYGTPDPVEVLPSTETSGIDAELAVGATVTGHVGDPEGDPLSGAFIQVTRWWEPERGFWSGTTNASGDYSIPGLPPTYLLVRADPPASRPDLFGEYYDNAFSTGRADPVLTTLGAVTPGINLALGPGGSLSGTLTDADGNPLAGAFLHADTVLCCEAGGDTETGADGTWTIDNIGPGDYYIHFHSPDEEESEFLWEYYDNAHDFGDADIVSVGEGEDVTGLDAVLDRGARISGRVTGLDGRGAGGVAVVLTDEHDNSTSFGTNAAGMWSASRLSAGDYTIEFRAAHGSEWHDEQLRPDGATIVSVEDGGSATGIDATLDRIVIGQDFTGNDTRVLAHCDIGDPATFMFAVDGFDTSDGTTSGAIDFGDSSPPFVFSASGATVSHTYTWGGGASTGPASEVVVTLTGGPAHSDSFTVIPAYTQCGGGGPSFTDVPAGHPFAAEIECLVDLDVTTGFADGTFGPGANITRQAAVAWLWRLAGSPAPSSLPAFSDVGEAHPFGDAIAWADQRNIVEGFPDGTFRPGGFVTRQAMAAWMYRYVFEPPASLPTGFSDVPSDHPFAMAIAWASDAGIAQGFVDGTFRPTNRITRQAVAAYLCRLAAYDGGGFEFVTE